MGIRDRRQRSVEGPVYSQLLRAHQALQEAQRIPGDPEGQQKEKVTTERGTHKQRAREEGRLTPGPGGPGVPRGPIGPCTKGCKTYLDDLLSLE